MTLVISRRELIAGAGLAGLGSMTLGRKGPAAESATPADVDVVVVGAGLSGLTAARQLRKSGLKVHLLEARARTGGRMIRQKTRKGAVIDLGGQWGGETHHRFESLVEELGLERFPVTTVAKVYWCGTDKGWWRTWQRSLPTVCCCLKQIRSNSLQSRWPKRKKQ